MIKSFWRNLKQAPFRYPWLVFKKVCIYPVIYKTSEGYDAENYWHKRLEKYGSGLQGVGEEGCSEADNQIRYQRVSSVFKNICKKVITDPGTCRVLEIGVGTGRMTQVLYDLGVQHYHGIDITDTLFPILQEKFPGRDYLYSRANIVKDHIDGRYDVIVIIDVIEHIVEENHFSSAMAHLKDCLNPGGSIIITPIVAKNKRIQFYERHWAQSDLDANFSGFNIAFSEVWEPEFSEIKVLQSNENSI